MMMRAGGQSLRVHEVSKDIAENVTLRIFSSEALSRRGHATASESLKLAVFGIIRTARPDFSPQSADIVSAIVQKQGESS